MVTFLLMSFLNCSAQVKPDSGIVFDATVHQFGLIKRGTHTEHVFSFVNRNKTSVVISYVRTYCSCVSATWTKEPVKPNGSGEIKVKFYGETVGTFSKTVKVFTNLSSIPIDLSVRGQCQ
jgi:hypothetical protein